MSSAEREVLHDRLSQDICKGATLTNYASLDNLINSMENYLNIRPMH